VEANLLFASGRCPVLPDPTNQGYSSNPEGYGLYRGCPAYLQDVPLSVRSLETRPVICSCHPEGITGNLTLFFFFFLKVTGARGGGIIR
jgi:hypothetical protein